MAGAMAGWGGGRGRLPDLTERRTRPVAAAGPSRQSDVAWLNSFLPLSCRADSVGTGRFLESESVGAGFFADFGRKCHPSQRDSG